MMQHSGNLRRQGYGPPQQKMVKGFSTIQYYPSNSKVYRDWLRHRYREGTLLKTYVTTYVYVKYWYSYIVASAVDVHHNATESR